MRVTPSICWTDIHGGEARLSAINQPFARARGALRSLLASRCAVCDLAPGNPLCACCARDYFAADAPRCCVCALRLPPAVAAMRCGGCLRSAPHFDATVALADYAPPVDRMIAALKFDGRLPLARAFGTLLAAAAAHLLRETCAICPVPLAFERLSNAASTGRTKSPAASPRAAADRCAPTSCCVRGTRQRRWNCRWPNGGATCAAPLSRAATSTAPASSSSTT
jgi:hypothetical protein